MKKLLLSLIFISPVAFAEGENLVDKRQENQEQRIEKGVENGSLTDKEAARLKRQQGRVNKAEERAMADGKMDKKEAKHIKKMQNRASSNIYVKKHNKRGR
jgi:hypothetical protein